MRRSAVFATIPLLLVLGLSLTGCTPAPQPTADYQFNGTLAACGADAPALTALGGGSFASESVDGKTWKVRRFTDNSGVKLSPTTNEVGSAGVWTIVVLFKHTDPNGWNRIIEFKNGTGDPGLYSLSGSLRFYPVTNGATADTGNFYAQVVLTRAANGTVTGYVDGNQRLTFNDSSSKYGVILNNTLRFFQDNTSGGVTNEASAGAVARIRIFDKALTAAEVDGLDQLPNSPCSTT
jgi:hypothetical protein